MTLINHTSEGTEDEPSAVRVTRFFPNDGRHRFAGRVHEQVLCAGREPARADTGLLADHYGYTAGALAARDKLARNRALLERALAEDETDAYLWYQLGRTESLAGRHEPALAAFERALAQSDDGAPYGAHLCECAAYALRALGRSAHALAWLADIAPRFRERADTCFLVALLAMDTGDLDRAEQGFRRCLELAGTIPAGGESSPAASTSAPAYNLGVMREVLGRPAEALAFYRRALAFRPDHAPSLRALDRIGPGLAAEPASP
jgi:tetratricopeptide (TPR) repeat protein